MKGGFWNIGKSSPKSGLSPPVLTSSGVKGGISKPGGTSLDEGSEVPVVGTGGVEFVFGCGGAGTVGKGGGGGTTDVPLVGRAASAFVSVSVSVSVSVCSPAAGALVLVRSFLRVGALVGGVLLSSTTVVVVGEISCVGVSIKAAIVGDNVGGLSICVGGCIGVVVSGGGGTTPGLLPVEEGAGAGCTGTGTGTGAAILLPGGTPSITIGVGNMRECKML